MFAGLFFIFLTFLWSLPKTALVLEDLLILIEKDQKSLRLREALQPFVSNQIRLVTYRKIVGASIKRGLWNPKPTRLLVTYLLKSKQRAVTISSIHNQLKLKTYFILGLGMVLQLQVHAGSPFKNHGSEFLAVLGAGWPVLVNVYILRLIDVDRLSHLPFYSAVLEALYLSKDSKVFPFTKKLKQLERKTGKSYKHEWCELIEDELCKYSYLHQLRLEQVSHYIGCIEFVMALPSLVGMNLPLIEQYCSILGFRGL